MDDIPVYDFMASTHLYKRLHDVKYATISLHSIDS